jgi:monoamine oxidase
MEPCIGIVGAGIAGITAAKELVDMGHKVHVFEAQSQIGGRIKAIKKGGQTIDMGAAFLWGDQLDYTQANEQNPLSALIKHLSTGCLEAVDFLENSPIYDSKGANIQPELMAHLKSSAFQSRMKEFIKIHQKIFVTKKTEQPNTDYPLPCLSDLLALLFPPPLSQIDARFEQIIKISFLHKHGAGPQSVSLWNLFLENSYPGNDYLAAGAFSTLLDSMLKSIESRPNFKLSTNTVISAVEKNTHKKSVLLRTANGKEFSVDRVLITVPLGVLKKNTLSFYPALSTEKQTAISALRMGKCNKIMLRFEKAFWPEDAQSLLIFNSKNQLCEYLNVDYFSTTKTATLVVTLYGIAADFGDKSDEEIIEKVLAPLQRIYPHSTPLIDFFITRWESSPYTQGAFAYLGSKATPKNLRDMATPEWERLLFLAGEHTDELYYGSVHGAYLSGLRSSQSIDNSLHLPDKLRKRSSV